MVSINLIAASSLLHSCYILEIIKNVPHDRLAQSKMICIKDLVDSRLFRMAECREILLPEFCREIKEKLESKEEVCCGCWSCNICCMARWRAAAPPATDDCHFVTTTTRCDNIVVNNPTVSHACVAASCHLNALIMINIIICYVFCSSFVCM